MKGTTSGYNVHDEILCDILSRLPLKSLVRFKCVCKSWESLIEKDEWLIDSNHSRQLKTNPRLSFLISKAAISKSPCLLIKNLTMVFPHHENHKEITRATTTIQAISNKDLFVCKQVQKPINGMICLIDKRERNCSDMIKKDHAACLYNVITQEATPWIKSTYLAQVEQWYDVSVLSVSRAYEFGFDPTTKEYKVICMWSISGWELQKFEGYGEYKETFEYDDDGHILGYVGEYKMCEILTLGKATAWRRIDKVPPSNKGDKKIYGSVSANGSIYWIYENLRHMLVAFDVGSEEYRVIPNLDLIGLGRPRSFYLMGLDGHLTIVKKEDNHTLSMWILDDDCGKNINTTNIKWTKEIIILPLCSSYQFFRLYVVAETNYLILELFGRRSKVANSVHSYNREKKTFSKIEITGDESPYSSLGANIGHLSYKYTRYVESLLTLQRSYRPTMEAPDAPYL